MPTKSTVYLYLRTFFDEKNLDERYYHVQSPTGDTLNLIPTGQVIEAILDAPPNEQERIATTLRRIDFVNGDIHHYLEHLAAALAIDF